jgi:hypothetical protein
MGTVAVDLTKMSAAEIKAFIEAQPVLDPPTEPVVAEQPRDENGRFVSAQAEPVAEVQADPVETETTAEPIVVEKEIDLGDGSGIQIFRGVGPTQEAAFTALVDELAKAQANATKKIQELSRPAPAPVVETASPENEFLLAQRIMDTPRAAIRDVLKEEFGLAPAEIKAKLAAADKIVRDQQETKLAEQFMSANPDYNPVPQNGKRLERQLAIEGLPTTLENLQKVYNDLKADGLITAKPTDAAPVIRTRSSGLSTRSGVPAPPPKAVDLSKLTTEQLRELSGGYQNTYR